MNKPMNRLVGRFCAVSVATLAASAVADTHNVAAGVTDTLSGITETTATVKGGDGTLDLTGANTLKRLQVAGGTLHISGGTTTVSDSTATGTGNHGKYVFEQVTGNTLIDGGATVRISDGQYAVTESGTLTIENASLDATGLTSHFMNAFEALSGNTLSADGCKIVIGDGGVLKAGYLRPSGAPTQDKPQFQDTVGVVLKEGGKLYINQFWTDSAVSRYGRIWFDGGTVYPQSGSTRLFNDGNARVPWVEGQLVPTVMKGGFHVVDSLGNVIYPAFRSGVADGETDGGVHVKLPAGNDSKFFWFPKDSDYNGGTFIESDGDRYFSVNATYGDSSFGAVPASPATNIWLSGPNVLLYNQGGEFTIHPNRTIHVADGTAFRAVANAGAKLVIGGEIRGEITDGNAYPVGTSFEAVTNLTGTVVIGPGDDRTNDVGRLIVKGRLEVTNGVTQVVSATAASGTANAVLLVQGNNASIAKTKGSLSVTGGTLYAPQESGTRYVYVIQYGHADICGGTVLMPHVEWLNAQNTPALTTVRDGGVLDVDQFRVTQVVKNGATVVRLGTNGLLRANQLTLDLNQAQPDVKFLFDGGAIQSAAGYSAASENGSTKNSFIRNASNAKWDGVQFAIGPGGAVFDTYNGKNLWWHRPLVKATAGEPDGGLTARGSAGTAMILMEEADYNGPTTIDGCTLQQRGGDNLLPAGTKLVLKNGGVLGCTTYDSAHTPTATSFSGVEGDGELRWCAGVGLSGTIAPSIGGTLKFTQAPASLSNITLEIAGDATGCGKVEFNYAQDISGITLSMADPATFDKQAAKNLYKIVANGNYTGEFKLAAGWPSDWAVQHKADGVYLSHIDAFMLVVR